MHPAGARTALAGLAVLIACARSGTPVAPFLPPAHPPAEGSYSGSALLPPVPAVRGPLRIAVVYPAPGDVVEARDSTFLFGSAGTGAAELTINGVPVRVWPNGAWLAWLAIPSDSLLMFRLEARAGADTTRLDYVVRRTARFQSPLQAVWIDSQSASPSRRAWWPRDEYLPVSVRASEGAAVRLLLPGGEIVPMTPDAGPAEVPAAIRAFDRDTGNLATQPRAGRYTALLRGRAIGGNPGPLLGGVPPSGGGDSSIIVEAALGPDTARVRWPLQLAMLDTIPTVVEFNDDTAGTGTTDSLTVGRARPGATYHWFFPTGTRTVVSGRLGDDLRVRLSRGQDAWVPAGDAIALPAGSAPLRGTVASVTVTPSPDRLVLRIPLTQRVPFRVEELASGLTLRLYNSVSDVNWTRYGPTDPYLRGIEWLQEQSDEVTLTVKLAGPAWGYRTSWNRNDLLFEIRRPPRIDPRRPLAGRRIVIDPGHPPLGATGPTGLTEAEANLAVALELRGLLETAGATVLMTRANGQSLDLWPRVRFADSVDADVLVSIHNNALPDGVNPWTNNGASVFYNHLRSLPLAQAIQEAFVKHLGVRDLGAARGDLALVRPSWMPAVLTEGLFLMLPDQEAALRSPVGRRSYALAVRDGLAQFLKRVGEEAAGGVP